MTRAIEVIVDEEDFRSINEAIARRQTWQVMPDGGGNVTGRVLAEICRGWLERVDADKTDDESWKGGE